MKKRIMCLFTALFFTVFSCLDIFAIDTAQFKKPPELYAGAAVVMDADTGQVLYGKNEHLRMYPASLTKIMTCLLAMERGHFDDTVTITEEVVDEMIPRSTHIALSPGEKITFRQLLYAMMVESANDAANGAAIHMAGSIPMFAKTMNTKAQKIGAYDTHFTNANGLPNDEHYTTAYDLALITKEAFSHPEFRDLAGTVQYKIPPTNKNKNTRLLNNRNYMFTLGDKYDGAFAGKTGWTEEAGHCLMTLAQRDGITLICIVLKSDGVVDAEFKDSTALFNYGFDNFKRYTVAGNSFPTQQITYVDESGKLQSAMLRTTGEDMQVLLPPGVSVDDLSVSAMIPDPLPEKELARVRVELRLPEVAGEVMNRVAGSFPVQIEPLKPTISAKKKKSFDWKGFFKKAGYVAIAACIVGIIFWTVRSRSERLQRRRNMSSCYSQKGMSNDSLYYMTHHVFEPDSKKVSMIGKRKKAREKRRFRTHTDCTTSSERENQITDRSPIQHPIRLSQNDDSSLIKTPHTASKQRPSRANRPFDRH